VSGPLAVVLGAALLFGACGADHSPVRSTAPLDTGRLVTVASVYDGDTFTDSTRVKYRVLVIDSCEMDTPGGTRARTEARSLLLGKLVRVSTEPGHEHDRSGRRLVYVTLPNGEDFGELMATADHTAVYGGRHDAHPDRVDIAREIDGTPPRDCDR
jgi:endonuclease YncB( thermonuclease family)